MESINITYETGGVVVTHCLGVTEGFKYGIGLYDLIFKGTLLTKKRNKIM